MNEALADLPAELPPYKGSMGLLASDLLMTLIRLAIVGLLAIGLSGAFAGAMGAIFGRSFVSGDAPGVTYSKSRCADYLEYERHAHTCEQAATWHHFGETVDYRLAAGFLGLIGLPAYLFLRRRWRPVPCLPQGFTATVGTIMFASVGVALLGQAVDQLLLHQTAGAGAYLSAGAVSVIVGLIFGIPLVRTLLRLAAEVHRRDIPF